MKRPDGYLPRAGDVINLAAMVRWNFDKGDAYVFTLVDGKEIALTLDQVTDIAKINWRVGEWARLHDHNNVVGQVLAVHEDSVWMRTVEHGFGTFPASALEPCDDPTKPLEVDMNAIGELAEPRPLDRAVDEAMQEPPPAPEPCDACGTYHPDHMLCPPESAPTKPRAKKLPPGGDEEVVF